MSAQLIEDWNTVFEFQLNATSLQQPNEAFLYGAISCLLQKMKINVAQMDETSSANDEQHHRFRADFCQYVNQLIMISNPKDNFTYYDLVCPTAKKTVYVLKLLLNFYYFYGMVVDEVVGAATASIDAYNAAQLEVNRCRRQKQIQCDRQQEIDRQLEFLQTRIPYVLKTIEDLQQRSAGVQAQMAADQRQLTEAKLEQLAVQQRLQDMRDQVVTNREAADLQKALADLDAELTELDETERTMNAAHREMSDQIVRLNSNIEAGERFVESFSLNEMTVTQAARSSIAVAKQELAAAQSRHKTVAAAIQSQQADNERERRLVDEFEAKQSSTQRQHAKQLAEAKRDRMQAEQRCARLVAKLLDVSAEVATAEQVHAFVETESLKMQSIFRYAGK